MDKMDNNNEIKVERNRCRICLLNQKDFLPIECKIDENDESSLKYYEIINLLMNTDCEVKKDDGKPQIICIECAKLTQYAYKLKRRCEQSEITLENELKPIKIAVELINIKVKVEEKKVEENNLNEKKRRKIEIVQYDEKMKDNSEDEWKAECSLDESDLYLYKCIYCEFLAPTSRALGVHKIIMHDDQKEFKCNMCNMKFFKKAQLNKHKLRHTGLKRFKCYKCEASFPLIEKLVRHKLNCVLEKTFKCSICNIDFPSRRSLRRHTQHHYVNK